MTDLRQLYERLDSPAVGFIPDFGASVVAQPPLLFAAIARAGVPAEATATMVEIWNAPGDPFTRRLELAERLRELGISGEHATLLGKGFGLFGRQAPADWSEISRWIVHVHGKFFEIDENGDEPAVPYRDLVRVLLESGYDGFVSSEWEGWHWIEGRDGFTELERHHALLRRLLAEAGR